MAKAPKKEAPEASEENKIEEMSAEQAEAIAREFAAMPDNVRVQGLAASAQPIALLEAAWSAGQGDRWRRNSALQTILTGVANSLGAMKEHQKRIDGRIAQREAAAEEAEEKSED